MKKILLFLVATVSMTSCAFGPYMTYNVGLSNVEAPADAKTQYGKTKIIKLDVEGKTNYKYEDDYIDIMWVVTSTQFNFILKNKSELLYQNSLG